MIGICAVVVLVFYAFWIPAVLYIAYNWFTRKFNYLYQNSDYTDPKYLPFIRHDRKNWSATEFILVGIFIAPLRILLILVSLLAGIVVNKMLLRLYGVKDMEAERCENLNRVAKIVSRLITGTLIFALGFKINHYERSFDETKHPKLKQVEETSKNTTVIISNHVTWADILYFIHSPYNACFLSKAGVAQYPIAGFYSRLIQCIFIKRDEMNDRLAVLEQLKNRVQSIKEGKHYNKIVIFPEGTTTNGRFILPFKRGAFVLNTPLKIIALKYNGRIDPCFNMMNTLDSIIAAIFQLYSRLDVYFVEGLLAPNNGVDWKEYRTAVRDFMSTEFNLIKSPGVFEDKRELERRCFEFSDKEYE